MTDFIKKIVKPPCPLCGSPMLVGSTKTLRIVGIVTRYLYCSVEQCRGSDQLSEKILLQTCKQEHRASE